MDRVPFLSMVFMVISCIVGFAIPIILFIYFRKRKHADIAPFFIGVIVFIFFAMFLESSVHRAVFALPFGDTIKNNVILYALYGGLMAAIFEETGRLIAFKFILGKNKDKNINACMYGAGHGGFEAASVLGLTMIGSLALSVSINSGLISTILDNVGGNDLTQLKDTVNTLTMSPSYVFLLGIVERIFAVILQISLSVLVWSSVKGKRYLFIAALLIHFVADTLIVILNGFHVPLMFVELIFGVVSIIVALFSRKIYVEES